MKKTFGQTQNMKPINSKKCFKESIENNPNFETVQNELNNHLRSISDQLQAGFYASFETMQGSDSKIDHGVVWPLLYGTLDMLHMP